MSNRKGLSSYALARHIGVAQKTAWFMLQRIRLVLSDIDDDEKIDGIVEVDEAYFGGREQNKHFDKRLFDDWRDGKAPAIGIRSRTGQVRLRALGIADKVEMMWFIRNNIKRRSAVFTDSHNGYNDVGKDYEYKTVNHGRREYVRGIITTNGIESVWAVLKRGYGGVYHHWSRRYMPLYLAEFEARINMIDKDDGTRLETVLESVDGLRLTYTGMAA